jgi:hypothetical protein
MTSVRSWRFWVIVALALATTACAGRREPREEPRAEGAERNEQKQALEAERAEQKRAQKAERAEQKKAQRDRPPAEAPAAALASISTAPPPAAAVANSKVVFLRATNLGGSIAASVFDVTEAGAPKFIGIINRGNKLAYPVKPGLYTFMVVSEAADFMQATVIGGKTYYALVTPRIGVLVARFSFKPVRGDELGGKQFAAWDRGTTLVATTPEALAWAKENAAEIADKRDRQLPEWTSKSASDRAAQTLNAEDGR